jgi:hypothetical protein
MGRFINDSFNEKGANLRIKIMKTAGRSALCFFLKKDVEAGTELNYYYGPKEETMFWRTVCTFFM